MSALAFLVAGIGLVLLAFGMKAHAGSWPFGAINRSSRLSLKTMGWLVWLFSLALFITDRGAALGILVWLSVSALQGMALTVVLGLHRPVRDGRLRREERAWREK